MSGEKRTANRRSVLDTRMPVIRWTRDIEICVADMQDGCGEGPIWDSRLNRLLWVDILSGRLHTLDWPSKSVETRTSGVPVSALALTEAGDLVFAGGNGIWISSQAGKNSLIARSHEGQVLSINDCIADQSGRLLAGSTFFDGSEGYARGSLYAIEPDKGIRVLDTGFGLANGMGFSPDQRTLYITDSAARVVYAYDYDLITPAVTRRRTFVDVPATEGLPDGLTVDAEGFVWSAQWFGGCVCRYDPDGKLERRITIPAQQTSAVAFGGPDLTDIFVTTAATPDALSLAPPGYTPGENVGGQLYRLNPGIPGRPEHRCRFTHPL